MGRLDTSSPAPAGSAFATDAGDAWNMRLDALAHFLQIICNRRERVLILTGDIHYAGAMEFTRVTNSGDITQVVQFTAVLAKMRRY